MKGCLFSEGYLFTGFYGDLCWKSFLKGSSNMFNLVDMHTKAFNMFLSQMLTLISPLLYCCKLFLYFRDQARFRHHIPNVPTWEQFVELKDETWISKPDCRMLFTMSKNVFGLNLKKKKPPKESALGRIKVKQKRCSAANSHVKWRRFPVESPVEVYGDRDPVMQKLTPNESVYIDKVHERNQVPCGRQFSSAQNFVKSDCQAVCQEFLFVKRRSSLVCRFGDRTVVAFFAFRLSNSWIILIHHLSFCEKN